MTALTTMTTGQRVTITCEGRAVDGEILFASENAKSLMLVFDALLAGHVGMMPVLLDDKGAYRSLIGNLEIGIEPL